MGGKGKAFLRRAVFCAALLLLGFSRAAQAEQGAEQAQSWQQPAGLSIQVKPYAESLAGALGLRADVDFISVDSAAVPRAAEIADYVNAQALQSLFRARAEAAETNAETGAADYCADSAWKEDCANTLSVRLENVEAAGSFVALRYGESFMPVGAAHPMHNVTAYNFSLKPVFLVANPEQLFENAEKIFPIVQKRARAALAASLSADSGAPLSDFERDMLQDGTADWSCFGNFMLAKSGVKFLFSPYAVAPYAMGEREAEIPYDAVKAELKPFYRAALGLQ